jgi:hypothetical protein
VRRVELKPRVAGFDFPMLMALATQGVGITMLPETVCAEAVRNGELEVVLPQWRLPQGIFHAVFASRRGLLPAVRVFIDFLAERVPALVESARLQCGDIPGKPCPEGIKNTTTPAPVAKDKPTRKSRERTPEPA